MLNFLRHAYRVAQSVVREHQKARRRSPKWVEVRREHVQKFPFCAACGDRERLQVHHVEPYHLRPDLELDRSNLLTLCMGPSECHLRLGHGDDFDAYNPAIRRHARELHTCARPREAIEAEAKQVRLYVDAEVTSTGA